MLYELQEAAVDFIQSSGLYWLYENFTGEGYKNVIMIAVALGLMYLAIKKQYEPLLLLPISFGMLLVNLPISGVMSHVMTEITMPDSSIVTYDGKLVEAALAYGPNAAGYILENAREIPGGLIYYLYQGNKLGIFPPLIFMGVGALTDFGPLLANPKSFLLGAAAQFGIFLAFFGALAVGFTTDEAASIAIIGGADGPTAIFTTIKLAPHLLGPIAVAAYSYMSLVPIIQPPIMKLLTTKEERRIKMKMLRPVSQTEKIIFPILVTIVVILILPTTAPLIGMLMFGNLIKVSGVTEKLAEIASGPLMYMITIALGISVGATTSADAFLNLATIKILFMGMVAFAFGTAAGVLLGKAMNFFAAGKTNPLIGAAGVSAVPMAARVAQKVGSQEDPTNFLLMHAMGPNVAGVIGSAVAAGVFLSLYL
ncbi:sodium ion-translocating decarboxylase subunit beta [Anaerotalea alkaliphila]|uniref:Sodium ion-translocating decarboxylase subunit beta n=1 Tax=Anaerotalea alkaliphila TaxID=2662126 RepID=A0A7X5KLU9_9FIRM|nr:sodium ion-translocating decarboxylase subunit beta [Anaerotalea alkaliphila]NDL66299.1 sodium ion-translocating decarboxylase subunit beta [Anaerotalea alkaliphila]